MLKQLLSIALTCGALSISLHASHYPQNGITKSAEKDILLERRALFQALQENNDKLRTLYADTERFRVMVESHNPNVSNSDTLAKLAFESDIRMLAENQDKIEKLQAENIELQNRIHEGYEKTHPNTFDDRSL